jgi:hypothetical protein
MKTIWKDGNMQKIKFFIAFIASFCVVFSLLSWIMILADEDYEAEDKAARKYVESVCAGHYPNYKEWTINCPKE